MDQGDKMNVSKILIYSMNKKANIARTHFYPTGKLESITIGVFSMFTLGELKEYISILNKMKEDIENNENN